MVFLRNTGSIINHFHTFEAIVSEPDLLSKPVSQETLGIRRVRTYASCASIKAILDKFLDGRLQVNNNLTGSDTMHRALVDSLYRRRW